MNHFSYDQSVYSRRSCSTDVFQWYFPCWHCGGDCHWCHCVYSVGSHSDCAHCQVQGKLKKVRERAGVVKGNLEISARRDEERQAM